MRTQASESSATTARFLRSAFWDIPVDETATMLGLAAGEFYRFDVKALRPLADRIGRHET